MIKAIVTILAGAVAGGLTNTVAIWMLFHPYRPPSVAGRRLRFLHGAIPKNQPRLASAIGRAVGTRLLTEEDLTEVLRQPEFREAFDEGLSRFLHDLLEVERGSLSELLGPEVMKEVDAIVDEVLAHTADRIESYVQSEAFEESVEGRASALADLVADEPVGDLLTPAREVRITESAEEWIDGAVTGDAFREMVGKYVRRGSQRLLTSDLTIQDILPPGVAGTLERAVEGYVPLAIQRLGSVLDRPEARKRIERAVKDVLHRFMHDLKFHQRVVARLVMTEDTVKKVLRTLEVDGAERIRKMLRERPLREAMAGGIGEAIADLLNRPMNEVFGNPDDDAVVRACGTIESWIVDLARDPATRTFVTHRIEAGLSRASSGTWGDLIGSIPPERISEWVVRAARSDIADKAYRQGARALATAMLERPVGRPGRFLPEGAVPKIERALSEPLWEWVQDQIPSVVRRLDVAGRVETKVLELPVERMEKMVRGVTERELRMIICLGYVLGATIGGIMVVADSLFG
ncbi:MAG: DUF445 family protein [Gemmatimonadetes bacterium]|nr:DUF445 family protein [Gemmatimonadota bacterium]MYA63443.1 DUF445 family protein [Gemmatimonadota bacterium]MYB99913.1 DUF445 family protein [Gemmatimonadota bacterium]MYH51737.1 DUF445 family protein [Gemmatimonadota bacterium]MYI45387.1 DUF445 family protein [Gemmatimonadota bacterium]